MISFIAFLLEIGIFGLVAYFIYHHDQEIKDLRASTITLNQGIERLEADLIREIERLKSK